jgi:hypothetical protein
MPEPTPKPPKPIDLRFIDKLTREECQTVYERLQARGRQLRTEDTKVYGVKKCDDTGIRYSTREPAGGWRTSVAPDTRHSALWLTSQRSQAQAWADFMNKGCTGRQQKNTLWSLYAIFKTEAVKLPCYQYYKQFKEMTG